MAVMSRRSLINTSIGLAATATLARPYIANAQAKTATVWWIQGFAQEEDIAFKKLVGSQLVEAIQSLSIGRTFQGRERQGQ